jgi:flagellar motility protein MotE (MotC chaperone)
VKAIFKHLRLLPAVIGLGTCLLAVKGVGLVMAAQAQTAGPPAATAPANPKPEAQDPAGQDPAIDDSQTTSVGEVEVLTSLAKRRTELDAREQSLTMRANLLEATEKRVDAKIAALKTLEIQMQTLLGQRDAAQQKQIEALVKTYSAMRPKDAARIFNSLDDSVLLSVAQEMKPDVLGAILAQMQEDNAQKLTVALANRLKPPAPTPPAQVAALTAPASVAPAASAPSAAPASVPQSGVPASAGVAPPQTPASAAASATAK